MAKKQILKYILFQAAICFLTCACCCYADVLFIVVSITFQIGLFSAVAYQKHFLPCLAAPIVSYVAAWLLLGDWRVALAGVLFAPAGLVVAFCIRKKANRTHTVLAVSFTFGFAVAMYAIMLFALSGEATFERAATLLNNGIKQLSDLSVNSLPDTYFSQGITSEAYAAALTDSLRIFLFGVFALVCNGVAFFSTAIAKKAVCAFDSTAFSFETKWSYVLSKPSAAFFVICFLCILVGGDTLTLPERVTFYTVVIALLGGILLMAFRSIKRRITTMGFPSVLIYIIVYFMLGFGSLVALMSATGLIEAFKYKRQEDNGSCKKL